VWIACNAPQTNQGKDTTMDITTTPPADDEAERQDRAETEAEAARADALEDEQRAAETAAAEAAEAERAAAEAAAAQQRLAEEENPAAPPEDVEPVEPTGRLRIPEDTKGHYVVLFARKPNRGDQTRPAYREVAVVQAHDVPHAKRQAMGDAAAPKGATAVSAETIEFLRRSAAQKPGILLRAVPALNWPATVEATTFYRPEPVLRIG
jgi:hypothetical protein